MMYVDMMEIEIPASRVFLGAEVQLLGTSLAGVRKSLSIRVGLRLTNRYQIKYIGYLCINIQFKVGFIKIQHS